MKLKTFLFFISFFALLLAVAVFYAPTYLIVSEAPVRSDAVVLFLGGEKGMREKEAHQLIREGFADCLIIPARGQVQKLSPNGKLIAFNWKRPEDVSNQSNQSNQLNRFVEDTHDEVIIALSIMEHRGIGSAIFVSSPYHMRRIKLIAGEVFRDTQTLHYVPTRFETAGEEFWLMDMRQIRRISSEYAKIIWFMIYKQFI